MLATLVISAKQDKDIKPWSLRIVTQIEVPQNFLTELVG